jgi:hypothetical protein
MIQQRSHVKHTETLKNRLSKAAVQFEEVAANLPPESYGRD